MRAVIWLLMVVLIVAGIYHAAQAGWSYLAVSRAVDAALDHARTERSRAPAVRAAILAGASEAGVPLDERGLAVSDEDGRLSVQVKWSYTVLRMKGDDVLEIPFTLNRLVMIPAAR